MLNKINKVKLAMVFLLLILPALYVYYSIHKMLNDNLVIETSSRRIYRFKIEIADEPEEWKKGLMFRQELCEHCGMLFKLPERVQQFWMKDTFIPLDIIYIDNKGIIKKIYKMTTPESLSPLSSEVSVNGVLEINGGMSDKLKISVGDEVFHPYFGNL